MTVSVVGSVASRGGGSGDASSAVAPPPGERGGFGRRRKREVAATHMKGGAWLPLQRFLRIYYYVGKGLVNVFPVLDWGQTGPVIMRKKGVAFC